MSCGRSVSHKQKSSHLSWEPRPWRLMNSLSIFTASFNESYENWDKIQDISGWLTTFHWLGDFGFSFLKFPVLTTEQNTVQEILGRAETCILWNAKG